MTRKLKKGIALFLTVLMVVTMWTVPVYAEGSIYVAFSGINVTVKSGTIGENAASYGEDYTLTLEVAENYTVYEMRAYGYGTFENTWFDCTFDVDTGVLTIPKEEIDGYGEGLQSIYIDVYAMREYNADTDYKKVESLPFSDEFVIEEENNIGIGMDDGVLTGCMKLYEVDLTEGENLMYTAIGTDTLDTDLKVYLAKPTDSENIFTELDRVDNDNKGMGEIGTFTAPETGTYVFIVVPFDHQYDEGVKFELEEVPELVEGLDFTQEAAPAPGEDDLWAWDADTKTLTLKDGFEIATSDCAITVPDGTTINVEGNATITSIADNDAICCLGDVIVNLEAGAELNLSGYSGIYTPAGTIVVNGEADADGNLPVLKTDASHSGFVLCNDGHKEVIDGKTNTLNINNVKLDMTGTGGIEVYEGDIIIKYSEITADTYNECIYVDYYDTEPSEDYDIVIADSILDLMSGEEVIQSYIGGISITDCDTKIYSDDEEGIDVTGDVNIEGGRIQISSQENAIDIVGKLTITDSNFMLQFLNDGDLYDILWVDDLSIDGEFIIYDLDMNILHEGEMTDEIKQMIEENGCFNYQSEDGEFLCPKVVVSKFNGGTEDNAVEGVEEEYEEGSTLEFTTNSEGMDIDNPVWGYTRFNARTWEILDTDLSGVVDEDGNSIDISSFEEGTYTLRVRFEQQVCQRDYWSYYTNPSDDKIDYVDVQFKVLGADEEITPPPADDDEEITPPPAADDEEDKTPDTGAENFGFITVIVALLGVMVVAVKKNKKSAK